VTAAQKQDYGAGDDDAEAEAQDHEALPFAGSSQMQQERHLY